MANIIVSVILLAILVPVITYIVKAKKKGHKCIGCPYASSCPKNNKSIQVTSCCCTKSPCNK